MGQSNEKTVYRPRTTEVQNLAFTAAAANSTTFTADQSAQGSIEVLLGSTQDCFVAVGPEVTATTTTGFLLFAGASIQIAVRAGDRISAIRSVADGTLNICPLDV